MLDVVFVAPASASGYFKRLVRALGDDVRPTFHTMLLASAALPDPSWSLRAEADALRTALEPLERFHVVAASGGATVVLRYLAEHDRRERIQSLTLMEPPWVGLDDWSETEREFVKEFDRLVTLDAPDMWKAFASLYSPGAPVPEPPDIEHMALGLATCWRGYRAEDLDRESLAVFDVPVYLPVGAGSPARMRDVARLLSRVFPRARTELLEGCGHFDLFVVAADRVAVGIRRCFA